MSKLLPVPQALLAGALATVLTSVLVWLLTISGVFIVIGVAIVLPENELLWGIKRVGWGALAGVVFLFPVLVRWAHWKRGLAVSLVPIAALLLVIYPLGNEGWFGLNSGHATPIVAIVLWGLWGLFAGWFLDRWHLKLGDPESAGLD